MEVTYKIKKGYSHLPVLITLVDGKAVNLTGVEVKKVVAATDKAPAKTFIIPGATQEQLKRLYEEGNATIEKIEVESPDVKSKKADKKVTTVDATDLVANGEIQEDSVDNGEVIK